MDDYDTREQAEAYEWAAQCKDDEIEQLKARIEQLDKRNKELEAALRNCCDKWENGNGICEWLEAVDEARAALGEKKDG